MSAKTNIQWCHSTANPVMGCEGCELWPRKGRLLEALTSEMVAITGLPVNEARRLAIDTVGEAEMSDVYHSRESLAARLQAAAGLPDTARVPLVDVVRRQAKCYAGLLGTNRAGHGGYADQFEKPKVFPGRMAKAAGLRPPTSAEATAKPWLIGCPRLLFISDMGDALSSGINFDYLRTEIVETVSSRLGARHIWLWLTKRPNRMAEFGHWLSGQGLAWPENLVAMTTVTSQDRIARVDDLRKVPSRLKGLSLEPLFGPVNFPLEGIDWVIVGGGSDVLAEPLRVEWALDIQAKCREAGVAFFLKQLGRKPLYRERSIKLADKHGGEWDEWPEPAWRVREVPAAFRRYHNPGVQEAAPSHEPQ